MVDSAPTPARALLLCFVDTRPEPGFPDQLSTTDELRHFAPAATEDDLGAARAVRDQLAEIILGQGESAEHDLAQLCERLGAVATLGAPGAPIGWRLRDAGPLTALFTELITELIKVWTSGDIARVRVCASDACIVPFIDESRREDRRYCSPRCATRERVRKHRAQPASDLQRQPSG